MSNLTKKKIYSKDGVDIEEEALFSSFAGSVCQNSYKNSPFIKIHDFSSGQFRGPRPFSFKNLPKGFFIEASTDGIGTKGILIDAAKTHHLAAYDLIAMTASDITRFGGISLVFVNVFDTASIGNKGDKISKTYKSAIAGLGKVAKREKIVLLKGETAQMGDAIGSEIKDSKRQNDYWQKAGAWTNYYCFKRERFPMQWHKFGSRSSKKKIWQKLVEKSKSKRSCKISLCSFGAL